MRPVKPERSVNPYYWVRAQVRGAGTRLQVILRDRNHKKPRGWFLVNQMRKSTQELFVVTAVRRNGVLLDPEGHVRLMDGQVARGWRGPNTGVTAPSSVLRYRTFPSVAAAVAAAVTDPHILEGL